ncbi:MAG: hypothetical protein RBR43_06790 [Desulfuromonadaceae bacterium]|nr:hypothetical protein [Desulfuromonadaceae bacterium]
MPHQIPDLTDIEMLPIYEISKLMEAETGTPLVVWLHRMVKGGVLVCFYQDYGAEKVNNVLEKFNSSPKSISEESFSEQLINIGSLLGRQNSTPGPKYRLLKDQIEGALVRRENFHAWCISAEHPLPRFWFRDKAGELLSPVDQQKRLQQTSRDQAEDYAVKERNKNTPLSEIINYLEKAFGFKGQTLHDIVWPEKANERTGGQKRTTLSKHRKIIQ